MKVRVLLWLFWDQSHDHLTNGSTAVVCHCPQDLGALTHLDVSDNNLGHLVTPEGWETHPDDRTYYRQRGGEWTKTVPAGAQPLGIIAVANAIKDMGALTSLNLSSNNLMAKAAKIFAEAIEVSNFMPLRSFWHHFNAGLATG
jgi:hypothetical protein